MGLLRTNPDQELVKPDSLRFTTAAGAASAITALTAAVAAIVPAVREWGLADSVTVGFLGLMAAGLLGWAIASAGDVLARAYASAHVVPIDLAAPQPALYSATKLTVEAFKPAIDSVANTYKGSHPAAGAADASERMVALPVPLDVRVGDQDAKAVAAIMKSDQEIKYLLGQPGKPLHWKGQTEVYLSQPPTPMVGPQLIALPVPLNVRMSGRLGYHAVAALMRADQTLSYLVGKAGEGSFKWVNGDDITPE